jgi:GNAT superfamily N-acetyltransferase
MNLQNMEISITKASKKDTQIILDLLYELQRPQPKNDKDLKIFKNKIKDYFSDPKKKIFVAKRGSSVVGVVSIIFLNRLNQSRLEMYIPELVVAKKFRKLGIGKKLMQYCIDLAKKKNCYRIRLESGNQRKDSHAFYKCIGFDQYALSFSKII